MSYLLAAFMIAAGIMHFIKPGMYEQIMPPVLPYPLVWVYISGVAEIICGILLIPLRTRKLGAILTILLFIAVFPANIYQAITPQLHMGISWVWYVRLPLQLLLILWAWKVAVSGKS